ncbi:angiopoietin-related protein 7-like [Mizuhopecten yessoensis]|uniref:Angiopoietin-related protein 7 n=1 Tax=Mizuhopecten yessoensis TaxID=6573 RepID=A0A210QB96_MIZYE|nr:angiopoietin-related protein 7-like [Mizuhopecten yessoensis]OWF45991.1 Angiopoietin-related protein 7 [Mizuhopecten yessoensis]
MMAMETKLMCLIMLSISIDAIFVTKQHTFTRILRVAKQDRSNYTLISNNKTTNVVMCGARCENHGCFSFAYSDLDKTCDTYSRVIVEEEGAAVSEVIMYYSLSFSSCTDVPLSFVYRIKITEGNYIDMFCDMDSAQGPWTVIQRRKQPGDENFTRSWKNYKTGFGDLQREFWLGNDILHLLTNTPRVLRVELEAWDGTTGYAEYSRFQVAHEEKKYRLNVKGFSGNVSTDAMSHSHDQPFTTFDMDNDEAPEHVTNCAQTHDGAWWFRQCTDANFNGRHQTDTGEDPISAIFWWHFPNHKRRKTPLKESVMMVR